MPDDVKPEDWIGPMNTVETMLLRGDGGRHDQDIRNLKETIRNLESSIVLKRRELADYRGRKLMILHEIVKTRGKDPTGLPIRDVNRPHDGSVWIVLGGEPEAES